MAHIVKINGVTYIMENATVFYRRAGRRVRAWHKYVRGVVNGIIKTVCLHAVRAAAAMLDVGRDLVRAFDKLDDMKSRQAILMDAALMGGRG